MPPLIGLDVVFKKKRVIPGDAALESGITDLPREAKRQFGHARFNARNLGLRSADFRGESSLR